jgi:hypothetical protein
MERKPGSMRQPFADSGRLRLTPATMRLGVKNEHCLVICSRNNLFALSISM